MLLRRHIVQRLHRLPDPTWRHHQTTTERLRSECCQPCPRYRCLSRMLSALFTVPLSVPIVVSPVYGTVVCSECCQPCPRYRCLPRMLSALSTVPLSVPTAVRPVHGTIVCPECCQPCPRYRCLSRMFSALSTAPLSVHFQKPGDRVGCNACNHATCSISHSYHSILPYWRQAEQSTGQL